ncbi:MAG: hypothetical protein NZ530_00740 [Thermodesulfobacteriaceae bacterium]|nr:hypothetical protein [Thermodesulfobacteriaceae bacterium]MCX8040875.1 hypothetical protein [Thermodesulfobacteriaceae bacterium]MDW8136275.1 hypothetical protein [Thermodesulfobacterium sp.]
MKKTQLKFAGWLSIISAIITIPVTKLLMFLHSVDKLEVKFFQMLLIFISVGLFIYIYLSFKKLLNLKFRFHHVDNCISILIFGNITLSILNILSLLIDFQNKIFDILFISIIISLGVVFIIFGLRILQLSHDLFGLLKPFSYTSIIIGLCYSTIILIPTNILIPIGVVADVIGDVILGIIFLKAAQNFFY